MKKIRPEVVYLPPKKDLNLDHVIVCNAGIVSCRSISSIKKILSYEVPTAFSFENLEANYFVDITRFFKKKMQVMKVYKTEVRNYPHPRSIEGLAVLAQARGFAISARYAEAFMVIREKVA
jgi:LmbE family N-acetylglucosaminyl deacetylase